MQNIYTVGQINNYIKNMFSQDFLLQRVSVKGEISNCKYHTSGHIYFTLKDERGTLSCVMFAGNRKGLSFRLEEGLSVVVEGSVDIYEKSGSYQLYARKITMEGAGALYEKYEKLKAELEELGMFSKQYKQPIPQYSKTVGVITAQTGAAIQDIIQISGRRNPYVQLILYPAIVQGDEAVPSLIKGLLAMEKLKPDVIIIGRGGGSIEDLWAFNSREVAEAIFNCSIPVISAVGHETDTTIADFVADLRAPTPSAAAELAVFDYMAFQERLNSVNNSLNSRFSRRLGEFRGYVDGYAKQLRLLSPQSRLNEKRMLSLNYEKRIAELMDLAIKNRRNQLCIYIEKIKRLDPMEKMAKGFAYVENDSGRSVKSVDDIKKDDSLKVVLRDGIAYTKVEKIDKKQ